MDDHATHRDGTRLVTRTEQIKALTHPLRIRLIDLFRDGEELTATQCAEATGESVASCSFHLRQLARYGYLERGEPRGRERPWRAPRERGITLDADPSDREALAAVMAASAAFLADGMERLRAWAQQAADDDPEWTRASTQRFHTFWATPEELHALGERIGELSEPFQGRVEDPDQRPPGARRVRMLAAVWPDAPSPASRTQD
jgi:predicted transcriptional regulator